MDTKTFSIKGLDFAFAQPYAEGHVCTGPEAAGLNQLRKENISNNFRKHIEAFLAGDENAEYKTEDELRAAFAEYEGNYTFTFRAISEARTRDPIERKALSLAKARIKEHLASQGRKLTDVPEGMTKDEWEDKLASEIERVAALEPIVKLAKKLVAEEQKASSISLDNDIDLGAPTEGEQQATA